MRPRRRDHRAAVAATLAWPASWRGWLALLATSLTEARAGIHFCYVVRSRMGHLATGAASRRGHGASPSCRPGRAPCAGSIECCGALICRGSLEAGPVCCAAPGLPCLTGGDCCAGGACIGGICRG